MQRLRRLLRLGGTASLLMTLLVMAPGCISPGEKRQIHDDLYGVQTRLLTLERLLVDSTKETKESASKRLASTHAELERQGKDIAQMRGEIDALRVGVRTGQMPGGDQSQQDHSIAATLTKLSERLTAIEQAQEELLDALKKAGLKGKKKASHRPASSLADLRRSFESQQFKQVIDDAPHILKGLTGDERDEGRFLLAESLYKSGQLRDAALKFNEVLDGKPASRQVLAQTKLRMGDVFRRLGDGAAARIYYEELIHDFPDSAEALKAKERLAEAKPEAATR